MNRECEISIIIPTYNNIDELKSTLHSSIVNFPKSEILIIDSSSDDQIIRGYLKNIVGCNIHYTWTQPRGVYAAQNLGIKNSTGQWLIIINSGDLFLEGAGHEVSNALNNHTYVDIHIFGQTSGMHHSDGAVCFIPSDDSFWPHQSIIVKRKVYDDEGIYDCSFQYMAEQKFFAEARKKYSYLIHRSPLTYYDLSGISSKLSFKNCQENYKVRLLLGESLFVSFFRGFVTPLARSFLHTFMDTNKVAKLKARLFPKHYFKNK